MKMNLSQDGLVLCGISAVLRGRPEMIRNGRVIAGGRDD